jgi:hypothetical protein
MAVWLMPYDGDPKGWEPEPEQERPKTHLLEYVVFPVFFLAAVLILVGVVWAPMVSAAGWGIISFMACLIMARSSQ